MPIEKVQQAPLVQIYCIFQSLASAKIGVGTDAARLNL
jgi:hypothetical protein